MNDLDKIIEPLKKYGTISVSVIGRYKTLLTVLVAAIAIFTAVTQAQEFLNPPRNESKFTEIKSQVNVKSIDQDIVTKLEKTQSDRTDTATSNFVPNRNNPFAE